MLSAHTAGRSYWPSGMPFLWPIEGLPVVVANPTMPVGPGDRGLSPPTRLIVDFCSGRLPATMDCTLNLIDVRDVAVGLSRVMERGKLGRRYLLGHANLTLVGFLELLSELTDVPDSTVASALFDRYRGRVVQRVFRGPFYGPSPKATLTGVRLAKRIMHFDASRSLAELGLQPRSIRESLVDAVEWLRSTGQLPVRHAGPRQ